ncbi:SDR family oxidoreductase [Peribacillus frigoritolerans]|uniref:SDR family oxidoreductase n=1 Tax=Peribacillus frigoritolerans TaxID=450367 RepID=UPI0023DAD989|nr:SDR family NAD(P)-dependent oxidoreductase [Peribacillus frigoritolerans]MDF1999848.1 SDR family NAD(P)-dependent oxidoreductase [Peribacillus frigoritolerans]
MDWTEKVVVVTGASKSIGKSISAHFADLGSKVVLGYRSSRDEIEQIVQEIKETTGNSHVTFEKLDVTDREIVKDAFQNILDRHGKVDVLVNNAGISYGGALIPSNPLEKWEEIVDTNIMGTINCIHAVSLPMLMQQSGSIVNIASLSGLIGVERLSAYSASKAGVIGLTRSLGKEYAPFNVRVNAVAPGYIEDTGMVDRIPENQMNEFKKKIAMKRLGSAKEVAETVSFLASEKAGYITGQTLVVDGGLM